MSIIAAVRQTTSGRSSRHVTTPARGRRRYGQRVPGLAVDSKELQAGVFNENEVRAAAGLTMVIGAVAFSYAYFRHLYLPLQVVATFFFVEFLIRVTAGLQYSPTGIVAHAITRQNPPQWVSAKPKRFAWTLGLVTGLAMTIITNSGIRGYLPRTICLICLTLMWMETALGLCLGCEIQGLAVRRGWAAPDPDFEVCANGACDVPRPASQAWGTAADSAVGSPASKRKATESSTTITTREKEEHDNGTVHQRHRAGFRGRHHPGQDQLPRMDRRLVGGTVLPPQGLHPGVHH